MNVLMLGWELPPFNSGGLGEACLGLTKALAKKNINITFVLPKKIDIQVDHMQVVFADLELDKIYAAYSTQKPSFSDLKAGAFSHEYIRGAFAFADKIQDIAEKHKSDLVHSHDWMTFPAGIRAKKILKKPLITHIHSTEYDRTGGNFPDPLVYAIEKEGIQNSDRVLSVSNLTKNIILDQYGANAENVEVVHNGVDTFAKERFPQALTALKSMGYKVILFLGRITLQKGPEYFVKTAQKIAKYEDKVVFVVVGSGDMQEQMIGEAARLGVLNKFLFTGFLRGIERDRIYQAADVYIMPSVSEPFGITSLEAVSNDTCVLASKQSGVSEVLTHILKVDFWDTNEMANKIISLLRYPALQADLKNNSKKELKGINWDKAADKCVTVYRQLYGY